MGPIHPHHRNRLWEGTGTPRPPFGGYGRPTQSIDANISEDRVRYIAEMPVKDESTEAWLKGNAAYLASTKLAGEA